MVQAMLDYGGRKARGSDLFGNQDPVAITKRLLKGLKVKKNISLLHLWHRLKIIH